MFSHIVLCYTFNIDRNKSFNWLSTSPHIVWHYTFNIDCLVTIYRYACSSLILLLTSDLLLAVTIYKYARSSLILLLTPDLLLAVTIYRYACHSLILLLTPDLLLAVTIYRYARSSYRSTRHHLHRQLSQSTNTHVVLCITVLPPEQSHLQVFVSSYLHLDIDLDICK